MMSKEKNMYIQGLRGVGIALIVLFHFVYRFQEIYLNRSIKMLGISNWGTIGVGLFFIISGYMMAPSKDKEKIPLFEYFYRKISKLWMPYAVCITIIFISCTFYNLPERSVNFSQYIMNLLGVNGFINVPYVDGAHWYLTYLISFTLTFGIIQAYFKKDSIIMYLLWTLNNTFLYFVSFNNSINIIKVVLYKVLGGPYIAYIIIGIMLFKIYNNENTNKELYIILVCLISLLLTLGIAASIGAIISTLVFIGAIKSKIKVLNSRLLVWLGNISYIVYLIHQNIGYQIELYLTRRFGEFNYLFACIAIIVILLLAININLTLKKFSSIVRYYRKERRV